MGLRDGGFSTYAFDLHSHWIPPNGKITEQKNLKLPHEEDAPHTPRNRKGKRIMIGIGEWHMRGYSPLSERKKKLKSAWSLYFYKTAMTAKIELVFYRDILSETGKARNFDLNLNLYSSLTRDASTIDGFIEWWLKNWLIVWAWLDTIDRSKLSWLDSILTVTNSGSSVCWRTCSMLSQSVDGDLRFVSSSSISMFYHFTPSAVYFQLL